MGVRHSKELDDEDSQRLIRATRAYRDRSITLDDYWWYFHNILQKTQSYRPVALFLMQNKDVLDVLLDCAVVNETFAYFIATIRTWNLYGAKRYITQKKDVRLTHALSKDIFYVPGIYPMRYAFGSSGFPRFCRACF